ncbi:MAG: ATP-binding protein [Candidatus Poribacteria bacterium]|nr:ATP-binding protein [Candidatus Poribacteria bacterium]
MRLQWKYALIVNLSVLAILVSFYWYDDFIARRDLKILHDGGVKRGAVFKGIAEKTVRPRIEAEIERWQEFKRNEIEYALRALDPQHMENILDIHVTVGDSRIQASLIPNNNAEDRINLNAQDRLEIDLNGVTVYDTPPINGNKYATAVIIPYEVQLYIQPDLSLEASVGLHHQSDLENETISDSLRQELKSQGVILSQNVSVASTEKGKRWLITDTVNGQRYVVWKYEDRLSFLIDKDTSPKIKGYIQVLFEVPDIARLITNSRQMHLLSVIIVSVLLVIIIDMTTTRLIIRPLERMMEIIKRAEAGNLESLPESYSSGEISRITATLVRMLRQLQQTQSKRIAALGQLAAGVAHEIRNPLNTIGMTAQHLKELFLEKEIKPQDIEETREFLNIVNYEIEQLRHISEQFLTLNRPKELNLEPTQLNELLDRVLAEFTLTMENANVQVVKKYENLPHLNLDAGLIRQAIFNFIRNSIQAMPKGGSIYITTELEMPNGGAKQVALEIRDTGIGIPNEIQERIFDAYFTTKEKDGGMGLGLAISHQIIMAHQGAVEFKSQVGMGTAFMVTFPLSAFDIGD